MLQSVEFKGIILFSKDYKEKDRLVKIFTEHAGKMMFFARNVQRKNNPLKQAIINFHYGTYMGKLQKDSLSFLNGVKTVDAFLQIQTDIFLNAFATYILSLVDAALEDNEYDPSLYGFTKQSLQLIDQGYDAQVITNIFELQILSRFGVQLNLYSCAICGRVQEKFAFSSYMSGIVCTKHRLQDKTLYKASPQIIHFARMFSNIHLNQIRSINISDETKQELRVFIDALYDEYVGIKLKSKKFLDQMKDWT
ncbi:MAG: DNA repair protein RecO [Streptococcaceae bacterium]|jgi:DNA repair protein RecO (recombination protein O)|nr:DNA repair protein RecO [Streptococcaceae bacterium]